MRRHDSALPMHQRNLRVLDLPRTAFAAQLLHRLGDRIQRPGLTGMAMRQQAAVRIDREFAAQLDATAFNEASALALRTKAKVFELDDDYRREAIVEFG